MTEQEMREVIRSSFPKLNEQVEWLEQHTSYCYNALIGYWISRNFKNATEFKNYLEAL